MIKKAYTLIELMIVISIIIIIAGIGVGAYNISRRNAVVEIEANKLTAALHSVRETSKTNSFCYGINFIKNKFPAKIKFPYKNGVCDHSSMTKENFVWPKEINASQISADGTEINEISVVFMPPAGAIEFMPNASEIKIGLAYKTNKKILRSVAVSGETGKIEKE